MKQSIEWHKQCLTSSEHYLQRAKKEMERAQRDYEKSKQRFELYSAQIEMAEKAGKDGFDSDRYGLKKLIGV